MKRLMVMLIILLSLSSRCPAPDIWMNVDAAVVVPVNKLPLTDSAGVIDTGVTYDEAGISLVWNFSTTAGAFTSTAVTPTTGSNHDWAEHAADKGMYTMEIPASGGTVDNDTEGTGWWTGNCTATVVWCGPSIGFRHANKNDLEIDDGTAGTNQDAMWDGTGYAGGTIKLETDIQEVDGDATAATNMEVYWDTSTASIAMHDFWDETNAAANMKEIFITDHGTNYDGTGNVWDVSLTTDSVDADALKTDAITEIWAKAMSDMAAGAPSATASVHTAINWIYELCRNKTITNTTGGTTEIRVYKDDGTTILCEANSGDDGTNFTRDEFGAED